MKSYLYYEDPNGGFADPDTPGASVAMIMYGSQKDFKVLTLTLELCMVPLDSFYMDKLVHKLWGLLYPDGKIYPTIRVNKELLLSLVDKKGKELQLLWEDMNMMEGMLQFVEAPLPCGNILPPHALEIYKQFCIHVKSVLLGCPAIPDLHVVSLSEMKKQDDCDHANETLKMLKDAEKEFQRYHVE